MARKTPIHNRANRKNIEVITREALAKTGPDGFFVAQGKALVLALLDISDHGKRVVNGSELLYYFRANFRQIWPTSTHKDPMRIYQIYHAQLVRAGIIRHVD